MTRYILRRILQAIPTFFGITILVFIIMSLVPGGFVELLYFGNPDVTPEDKERLEDALGLNDPLPLQYIRWLLGDDWQVAERRAPFARLPNAWMNVLSDEAVNRLYEDSVDDVKGNAHGILRGDFGRSFHTNRDALKSVLNFLPASIELGAASLLFGLVAGIPVGIIAAIRKGGIFDNVSRVFAVFLNAIPNFWLGLIFLYFFAFQLGILPTGDRYDIQQRAQSILQAGGDPSEIPIPPIWTRLEYHGVAGDCAGRIRTGGKFAPDAHHHARYGAPGLHPHRAFQRLADSRGVVQAWRPQRPHPDCRRFGAGHRLHLGWRSGH